MVKVSVIVPIYNTKKEYLNKCLNSITNQTLKDIEIILIDDGSTNDAGRICDKMALKDKRIRVIHQENHGVSNARNSGIKSATGEFITFVDSDDTLQKNALKDLYEALQKDTEVVLSYPNNNSIIINNNLPSSFDVNNFDMQMGIFYERNNYPEYPWAKLYKTSFLKKNKLLFNEKLRFGEDGTFNFEVYQLSKKIKYLNKKTYNYIKNESSVCNNMKSSTILDFKNLFEEYDKLFIKYNNFNKFEDPFNYFIIRYIKKIIIGYFIKVYSFKNRKKLKLEFNNFIDYKYCKIAIKNIKLRNLDLNRKIIAILLKIKAFDLLIWLFLFKKKR